MTQARKKRIGRRAIAALATAALAVGASGASASPTAKSDVVTLNLEYANTVQNAFEATIADFEGKYPDIQINATYLDTSTETALLATQIQSGSAPDLFVASAGTGTPTSIWTLAQAGKLLDLSGSPFVKNIPPSGLGSHSYNGQVYGFPLAVSTNGLFYNTALFK